MLLEKGQSQAAAILLITLLSFSYMYLASAQDANNSEQPNQEIPQEQLPDQNASQQPTTEATVQEQAAQDQNILQEATQEQPADQNVLQEPAQDQNASEQSTRQPVQPTSIEIVSPLEAQEVFGETIIVTAVSDENAVVSAWYSINSLDENISYAFDSNLSAVLHFNASWDSTQAQNGSYLLQVFACSTESCSTDSAGFYVNNPSMPVEEPEEQAQTVSVNASNIESVVSLSDSNANLVASGFQGIIVPVGQYTAEFLFTDPVLESAEMQGLLVDSNKTLLEAFHLPETFIASELELNNLIALKPNASFSLASATAKNPPNSDSLFECADFDFSLLKCNLQWVFLKQLEPEKTLLEFSQPKAFAFNSLQPGATGETVSSGRAKDLNALDQNTPKKPGLVLSIKAKKKSFRADEAAEFLFEVKTSSGEAFDANNVSAFLTAPDNEIITIHQSQIVPAGQGSFLIFLPPVRSKKAGQYSLTVELPELGTSSTDYFSWGVVAVNSRKPIYRPGETAEFEIVVLDNKSYPVCDATILQTITSPSNTTIVLSTETGTIAPTPECGVYASSYQVQEEGTYAVVVAATAKGVENSIDTTFDSRASYEFDIIRTTATKIDPQWQPYSVQIEITSYTQAEKITVKEFVPIEFEVTETDASIETDFENNLKILSWERSLEDSQASVSYSYSVPLKYPWLYYIGPAQISYNSLFFSEARAWMIAVDINPTTQTWFRANTVFLPDEPTPNTYQTTDTISGGTWQGRGMNDSNGGASEVQRYEFTSTSTAYYAMSSFTTPPLIAQSIGAPGATIPITKIIIYCSESKAQADATPRATAYVWKKNDSKGTVFLSPTDASAECDTTTAAMTISASLAAYITVGRGDKLVAEVYVSAVTPANPSSVIFGWGNDVNLSKFSFASSIAGLEPTFRLAGDINTGILSPAVNSNFDGDTNISVVERTNCLNYFCDDGNAMLRYCVGAGCANNWYDINLLSGPLRLTKNPGGSSTAAYFSQLNAGSADTNTFTIKAFELGAYTLRTFADANMAGDINDSGDTNTDKTIWILKGTLSPSITNPSSDGAQKTINLSFDVNSQLSCTDRNCGQVDANLQYSVGAGTTTWYDLNTSAGLLQLAAGSPPNTKVTNVRVGSPTTPGWQIIGNTTGFYELRVIADGNLVDANNTNGTSNTIQIVAAGADYSFAVSLPSSGCTQGKGSYDAGGSCDRGYFETTDLTSLADQNKVDADGQTSSVYFFVFDNQSTSSNDLNISMDLNAALPATLKLKLATNYNNWNWSCNDDANYNCVLVTNVTKNIGKALYTTGQKDYNLFAWADFVSATAGQLDANLTHRGGTT